MLALHIYTMYYMLGELLVEKWKAALYSFVCAKTIFVNGMTLSTEFNKSHICVCVAKKGVL